MYYFIAILVLFLQHIKGSAACVEGAGVGRANSLYSAPPSFRDSTGLVFLNSSPVVEIVDGVEDLPGVHRIIRGPGGSISDVEYKYQGRAPFKFTDFKCYPDFCSAVVPPCMEKESCGSNYWVVERVLHMHFEWVSLTNELRLHDSLAQADAAVLSKGDTISLEFYSTGLKDPEVHFISVQARFKGDPEHKKIFKGDPGQKRLFFFLQSGRWDFISWAQKKWVTPSANVDPQMEGVRAVSRHWDLDPSAIGQGFLHLADRMVQKAFFPSYDPVIEVKNRFGDLPGIAAVCWEGADPPYIYDAIYTVSNQGCFSFSSGKKPSRFSLCANPKGGDVTAFAHIPLQWLDEQRAVVGYQGIGVPDVYLIILAVPLETRSRLQLKFFLQSRNWSFLRYASSIWVKESDTVYEGDVDSHVVHYCAISPLEAPLRNKPKAGDEGLSSSADHCAKMNEPKKSAKNLTSSADHCAKMNEPKKSAKNLTAQKNIQRRVNKLRRWGGVVPESACDKDNDDFEVIEKALSESPVRKNMCYIEAEDDGYAVISLGGTPPVGGKINAALNTTAQSSPISILQQPKPVKPCSIPVSIDVASMCLGARGPLGLEGMFEKADQQQNP